MQTNKKSIYSRRILNIFLIVVLVVWIALAAVFFMYEAFNIEINGRNDTLEKASKNNAIEIEFVFEKYSNALKIVSIYLENVENLNSIPITYLKEVVGIEDFLDISLILKDGTILFSNGTTRLYEDYDILLDKFSGTTMISDVEKYEDDEIVSIYVPIYDAEKNLMGFLQGKVSTITLSKHFNDSFFSADGYYHVIDINGQYVATSNTEDKNFTSVNFYDAIQNFDFSKQYSIDKIKTDFMQTTSGLTKYYYQDTFKYAYYMPVGINDWMIMSIINESEIENKYILHVKNAFYLVAGVGIVLILLIFYIYYMQKESKEKLLLNQECFKALSEQTNKIIIEWSFENNTIVAANDFNVIFGRNMFGVNNFNNALSIESIHEKDKELFIKIFERIRLGKNIKNVRFRIKDMHNNYLWCEFSSVIVKDKEGNFFKAVGSLENVDKEVKSSTRLKEKAQRDSLTNLYNKGTTEELIKKFLDEEDFCNFKSALIIIDVDNFKSINDNFGHKFGDMVIKDLSKALKSLFRVDDVVGRIGGDEFFVFLKSFNSQDLLEKKAKEIIGVFKRTYRENDVEVNISASIGIAVVEEDEDSFDSLYVNADAALYYIKEHGKNGYKIYEDTIMTDYFTNE